jgi:hypothetical protein
MTPVNPALFEARDRALPGREAAELNELCRALVEALRQPPSPSVLVERMVVTANVVALRRG